MQSRKLYGKKLLLASLGVIVDKQLSSRRNIQAQLRLQKNQLSILEQNILTFFHFLLDGVKRGDIKFEYCMTEKMSADKLTKSVLKNKFFKCRNEMGLQAYPID